MLRRFVALDARKRKLVVSALGWVLAARVALRIRGRSFPEQQRLLGWLSARWPTLPPCTVDEASWAVTAAARRVPGTRCLAWSLALRGAHRRRRFGAGRDQGPRVGGVRGPKLELGRRCGRLQRFAPAAGRAVSGLVALFAHGGAPVDAPLLQRMTARQRFRGPDGEAIWHGGSVGLGHALHRTTVEAEREVSPASLGNRLFITADARVDARDELCARL